MEEYMQFRKYHFLIPVALGVLLIAGLIILWPAADASAQCGSQASSCKNCHEVQGQDPVNNDGTGWHQSHAFGDFCYLCHAGNSQSMDEATAHTGMVAPLSDVKAACQSCHPADLMDRAQVYATALGVEVGTGGGSAPASSGGDTGGTNPGSDSGASSAGDTGLSAPVGMVVDSADVIDYNLRYEGKTPINWGNLIVALMIGAVALGGGGYVMVNERKLRGLPAMPVSKPKQATTENPAIPQIEGYSSEVLSLLPRIAQLNPVGLHALNRLLENPDEASELLHSLSRLDPELVRRIRSLDRESRAILLALSGGD
jgi:hypothetical protein